MLISRIQAKYGFTSTALNEACMREGKRPIYLYSDYFIDKECNVYKLSRGNSGEVVFNKLTPERYTKRNVPMYQLINDVTKEREKVRVDYAYLSTFYGPMPLNSIKYGNEKMFDPKNIADLRYTIFSYHIQDTDTIFINGVEFKRYYNNNIMDKIYITELGTCFNERRQIFLKYNHMHKLYVTIPLESKNYMLHRMVHQVWNNDNKSIGEGMQVDHIDGYKNHNWAKNLREISNLDNFRNAAYEQNLRTTPWTYEIIHFMCKQMEDPTVKGPTDINDRIKERFPNFNVKHGAVKHKIYEILNKESWIDVSSKYNVDVYRENFSSHNKSPTKDEIIHRLCKMVQDGTRPATNKELAKELGINPTIVNQVLRGEYRKDISSQYNIKYSEKKRIAFTEEEVHNICKDIMTGRTIASIGEKYNRTPSDIKDILRREKHIAIGQQYNFESVRSKVNYLHPYNPT